MKRFCFLLVLLLLPVMAGCCYAPGFEDTYKMEDWYKVPTFPTEEYVPLTPQTPTEPTAEPIPDPVVNLEDLPERKDSEMVKVVDYIPDIVVDLKYATEDNFTGKTIYTFNDAYLRYSTVQKLMLVQQELRQQGLKLKIWDGFRPVSAQFALWEAYPDPKYVANPETGHSSHSRGNTLDITLVNAQDEEVEMPSAFDNFSSLADRDYSDCTDTAAANAELLEQIMKKHGFTGYENEWWHFTDDTEYTVATYFDPSVFATYYAYCNQYINLRTNPDVTSNAIAQINANEQFTLLGWSDRFAYIEYEGVRGYVNADYIKPVETAETK